MKLLTRYILKEILYFFFMFLAFTVVFMLAYEVYDTRKDFIEKAPALSSVIQFLALSIPDHIVTAMPYIVLMSTVFAYGLLAKNREILAMVAAGISFARLARPAIIFGLAATVSLFWLNEFVAPVAQSRARQIEKVDIAGKSESVFTRRNKLFVKGENNRFYYMQHYLTNHRLMIFPVVIDLDPTGAGIVRRIEADTAWLIEDESRGGRFWHFVNVEQWTFRDGLNSSHSRLDELEVQMEENLDKFLSRSKRPEEMNYLELKEYRDLLAAKQDENVHGYTISLHRKLERPISTLLMVLLGFTVVVDVHSRRFTQGVVLGLLVAVGYSLLVAVLETLGRQDKIAPLLAGWLGLVVFAGVIFILYRRLFTIRR